MVAADHASRTIQAARWKTARSVALVFAWACIMFLALRFIVRFVFPYLSMEERAFGRFWPRRAFLLPHIVAGSTALLLGPFQFWSGLHRRAVNVHRWTGRLYLIAILVSSANAFYLLFFIPPPPISGGLSDRASLFTLAVVWLASAVMAYSAIRNGYVERHKEWMIRSYVLTFFFVNARWWVELPFIRTLGTPLGRSMVVTWLAWALPLFATEILLQWKHVRSA